MDKSQTQTEQNVQTALRKELQTASLYRLYARQAKAEGYLQICDLLMQTADNELEHAALLLELANRCALPSTADNLLYCIDMEKRSDYTRFADDAQRENLPETACLFRELEKVEENHARRFALLLDNVRNNAVFRKPTPRYWVCRICGALHHGVAAPTVCPVCGFTQACFSLYTEDY